MTNHKYIGDASQHGPNWITLFTGTSKKKRFCCSGSRSKHDKQWSVSWEYTFKRKPLVLPHQTQWLQKTEQSPAWEGNNLWKEKYEYFSKNSAQRLDSVNRPKILSWQHNAIPPSILQNMFLGLVFKTLRLNPCDARKAHRWRTIWHTFSWNWTRR